MKKSINELVKIKYTDGTSEVHFRDAIMGDVSLCGHDLAGDGTLGWEAGVSTKEKVNCHHCIEIVKYCKKLKL